MKVLVVTSRFPEPRHHGDQSRLFAHLRALAGRHELTVVTGGAPSSPDPERTLREMAEVVRVPVSVPARAAGALWAAARAVPGQSGWMTPPAVWSAARRLAPDHDVALINTARSVVGRLPIPTVIDHIDAMSFNMANRAAGQEGPHVRFAARVEAELMARWERRLARWVAAQLVTSADAAAHLPPQPAPVVFPAAWDGAERDDPPGGRDVDLMLTGAMTYAPNREAARLLATEILPAVQRVRPGTTACVVGRSAHLLGDLPGVTVAGDVPDVMDYLARAKVALIPLGPGAGSPYKTLEAAAAGAAIVATPWAVECYGMQVPTAGSAAEFAAIALRLLEDAGERAAVVRAGREALSAYTVEALGRRLEAVLEAAVLSRW